MGRQTRPTSQQGVLVVEVDDRQNAPLRYPTFLVAGAAMGGGL